MDDQKNDEPHSSSIKEEPLESFQYERDINVSNIQEPFFISIKEESKVFDHHIKQSYESCQNNMDISKIEQPFITSEKETLVAHASFIESTGESSKCRKDIAFPKIEDPPLIKQKVTPPKKKRAPRILNPEQRERKNERERKYRKAKMQQHLNGSLEKQQQIETVSIIHKVPKRPSKPLSVEQRARKSERDRIRGEVRKMNQTPEQRELMNAARRIGNLPEYRREKLQSKRSIYYLTHREKLLASRRIESLTEEQKNEIKNKRRAYLQKRREEHKLNNITD